MAELVFDERIEESFQSVGGGVFQLTGPRVLKRPFSSMRRVDGSPIQPGDLVDVTLLNQTNMVVVRCEYTPGDPALLTADTSRIFKSDAGDDQMPDFGTTTGIAFNVLTAENAFRINPDGGLADPAIFRRTVLPAELSSFLEEAAVTSGEAVLAQRLVGGDDYLSGLFGAESGNAEPSDDVDHHDMASPGHDAVRRSLKAWRTIRNRAIAPGQILQLFNADQLSAEYAVHVQATNDPTIRSRLHIRGGREATPSDPEVTAQPIEAFQNDNLTFDIEGLGVRIRNQTGGAISVDYTIGRIA